VQWQNGVGEKLNAHASKAANGVVSAIIIYFALVSCIEVDTFFNADERSAWQPFLQFNSLTPDARESITDYITSNSFFDAVVVVRGEQLLYSFGDYQLPMNCASARKSIYAVLFGIAQAKGLVDTSMTLAAAGLNDSKQPLTAIEHSAKIIHLLQARSGIYLKAGGETSTMRERKPPRGSHLPGTFFYYNNWDFNALPVILQSSTGQPVEQLIENWLAKPLGMHTYWPENIVYEPQEDTDHPHSRIYMSAEDLAKIGAMVLNNGQWNEETIVPTTWIASMLNVVSREGQDEQIDLDEFFEGYALLWWFDQNTDTYWASGFGGQFIIIDRANNFVTVLMKNTGSSVPGYLWNNATSRNEDHDNGSLVHQYISRFITR